MSTTQAQTKNAFFSRRMLIILLTGFTSGLPLLLTGSTLQAWLTDRKVDISTLGYFSLVGLPYTLKFLWAPLFDRFRIPLLGRRRGWMALTQIVLALSILALGHNDPTTHLDRTAMLAILVSFFSATLDILIDSYRRELLPDVELGLGSSISTFGYRMAMLFSGAFALYLSDRMPWESVYLVMALVLAASIFVTILSPEPVESGSAPRNLREAVIEPLVEYFQRPKAWVILLFILSYKIGDNMALTLVVKYMKDLGYTNTDIATIQKVVGMIALLAGGLLGGSLMLRLGTYRSLLYFGIFQMFANLSFSALWFVSHTKLALAMAISAENFSAGMGTAAYSGFMASLTNRKFTATQYALLTSLMGVSRVIFTAPAGDIVKLMGWPTYFVFCTALCAPGLMLLPFFKKTLEPEAVASA